MMNLASVTATYIKKSFQDCGCVELVVDFMRDIGHPLPDEIDGINVKNYRKLLDNSPAEAQKKLFTCFNKIGSASNVDYPSIGDLLVVQQRSGQMFPAVCVGPDMAIASFIKKGVMIFKLDKYNKPIVARRVD